MAIRPREENIRGSNLTGSSGATNRTYALVNSNVVSAGISVVINGVHGASGSDFSISGQTITFINAIDDDQYISIYYFTDADQSDSGADYFNTIDIIRKLGIGVEVNNENVGTGNGTLQSYDLDNKHIIDGSYSLYYSNSSSDNNFQQFTDSTHYSIDLDSGRIYLTTAGATLLSTKVLWAKYIHSPNVSDTILSTYVSHAGDMVDELTGTTWTTPREATEYFDGRRDNYPHTNRPYDFEDYNEPNAIQLQHRNVTEILEVSFLASGAGFGSVQSYDASSGSYTNNTDEANSVSGTQFAPLNASPDTGDIIYFGHMNKFHGMTTRLFTVGTGSPTISWEYYNGSSWTAFTPTEETTGAKTFTAEGRFTWTSLSAWSRTSVNGTSNLYYVRARLTAGLYGTVPYLNNVIADPDSIISKEIPLYSIRWDTYGRVVLVNDTIPNGSRNLKVRYKYGKSSVPDRIKKLATLYACVDAINYLSGVSFDGENSVTMGRVSVNYGDKNIDAQKMHSQFQAEISSLLKIVGRKVHLVA